MSAGALKTPSILQQSGIGPASVLQGAGVGVKVDLPVGMNLVDQVTSTTTFGFSGQRGGGQVITFPRFQVSLVDVSWLVYADGLCRTLFPALMRIDFETS